MEISDLVKKQRQDIKSDKMDMSFGEIINMYINEEIIISPEYQRAFRWDTKKQTDFIESILLGIPFPSIFVATDKDGKWELIDGLQRVSTVLSFFGELKKLPDKNNLMLKAGGLLPQLEGVTLTDLPMDLKLSIKRTPCRVEIIQRDSKFNLRYELFKRLNTGGEGLTRQEIRNCVYRGLPQYEYFSNMIENNARDENLQAVACISPNQKDEMLYEELCLRFFALYNYIDRYEETSIQDFFDKIMEMQSKTPDTEKIDSTFSLFKKICAYLNTTEENIFRLARLNFSTSAFDAITLTLARIDNFENTHISDFVDKVEILKKNDEFKKNAGSASSNRQNIKRKLETARLILGGKNGTSVN